MSQQIEGNFKTFQAGSALASFRRVKLNSSIQAVYAGAGEDNCGVTQQDVNSGDNVTVALESPGRTFKLTASGAITKGAIIYADLNGKVSATVNGTPLGVALETTTADGDVFEALMGYVMQDNAEQLLVFSKEGITDATTSPIIVTANFKFRIIDWWLVSRDTTAANVKLINGVTDATAVVAKGTTNDAIVRGGTIVAAQKDITAGTALKVNASAAAAFDVYVHIKRS